MTTLVILNDARIYNGKKPLKSWKESKAKLVAAIEAEKELTKRMHNEQAQTITTNVGTAQPEKTAALKAARLEQERKDAALQKMEEIAPSTSAQVEKNQARKVLKKQLEESVKEVRRERKAFSAGVIIREFGYTAKVGRALLRKHNIKRTPDAIRAFFKARKK